MEILHILHFCELLKKITFIYQAYASSFFWLYRDHKVGMSMENPGSENDSGVVLEASFDMNVDVSVKEVSIEC